MASNNDATGKNGDSNGAPKRPSTFSYQAQLPRLPIPSLEETMAKFTRGNLVSIFAKQMELFRRVNLFGPSFTLESQVHKMRTYGASK